MMNLKKYFLVCSAMLGFVISVSAQTKRDSVNLTLHFIHEANGKKLQRDSLYYNAFNEPYRISKLRYYVSNPTMNNSVSKNAFLIDAYAEDSFSIPLQKEKLKSLSFLLGVDSSIQTSGAHSGALDPMNGMYWTWNSGYINFKLEGTSDRSTADLQRIEHHIGGYRKPYETMRKITLHLDSAMDTKQISHMHIYVKMNLDYYWKSLYEFRIKDHALIMSSGELPARIADHFPQIFSIHSIQVQP